MKNLSSIFHRSALAACVFAAARAGAAAITWQGAIDGTWNTGTANWTGGSTVYSNGDQVTFAATGPTAINIAASVAPASTTFAANAQNYTFTGSGITGGTLTVLGGTQTLNNGANSYAGATEIRGGTLAISPTATILGTAATVGAGGLLDFVAGTTTDRYGNANALTLDGGAWRVGNLANQRFSETIGTLHYSGNASILMERSATGGDLSTVAITATMNRVDRGVLTIAPSNLTNLGTGTPRLWVTATAPPTPVNGMVSPEFIFIDPSGSIATFGTYAAATLAGVANTTSFRQITYSNGNAAANTANATAGSGTDTWAITTSATATLAVGSNKDLYALRLARSLNSGNFTITLRGGGLILDANTSNATPNISTHAGLAFDFGLGGSGAEAMIYANNTTAVSRSFSILGDITADRGLTKSGGATLAISGNNDWTGATQADNVLTVNGGTLRLDGGSMPSDSWVHVADGATFSINALSPTVLGLAGDGTVSNGSGSARTLTIHNATATDYFFGGSLADGSSGSLNLLKSGSATQTFTGASTYSGTTQVQGGLLHLDGASHTTTASNSAYIINGGDFTQESGYWSTDLFHAANAGDNISVDQLADSADGGSTLLYSLAAGIGVAPIVLTVSDPFANTSGGLANWKNEWVVDFNLTAITSTADFVELNLMQSTGGYNLLGLSGNIRLVTRDGDGIVTGDAFVSNGSQIFLSKPGNLVASYQVRFTEDSFDLVFQSARAIPEPGTLGLLALAFALLRLRLGRRQP